MLPRYSQDRKGVHASCRLCIRHKKRKFVSMVVYFLQHGSGRALNLSILGCVLQLRRECLHRQQFSKDEPMLLLVH